LGEAIRETGIELNPCKTKCMVMAQDENAERSHSMKIDNSSFEREEKFK
jgi:hypothetical protein